jgi:snapalysin
MVLRRLSAALLGAVLAVAAQLAMGAPAQAAPRVLYYDASRAAEFVSVVHQGASNWNSRVGNVRLEPVPAGRRANITVYADDGWPRSLGNGSWYMGRQAVDQGYHQPRIATHEFGHLLGLPDRRTGLCTDLMSGSSAPVSCTNAYPSTREAAEVNSRFAGGTASAGDTAAAGIRAYDWFGTATTMTGSTVTNSTATDSAAAKVTDSTAADPAAPGPGGGVVMVVGGRPASESYPFLVYVSGCTGSLIKANWAVTAKHCTTPSSVRVGSTNRTSGGTVVGVTRAVNHPSIDVKLLQLSGSVGYAPAPIPTSSGAVGTATRIIGWGQTCPTRGCGSAPAGAYELDTSIVADSRCLGIDGPYEICTNNTNGNSGACYGDSGGPQVRSVDGRWQLIGATSRSGNGSSVCATGPSIYEDLPSIRSWINTQVGGLPAA